MGTRRLTTGKEGRLLTRRTLLAGAAAAGAASLIRPGLGGAATTSGRSSVFSVDVGSLSGASGSIHPGRSFALAGIEWGGTAKADVELRAQTSNGSWSPWVAASNLGHDGDGQLNAEAFYGEPVWTGPAVALQLRSRQRVSGVRVHFVGLRIPGSVGAAGALAQAVPVLNAGPGQAPIIARRAWAAGQAHPVRIPVYGSVKLAFVHHTVNPNGYSAAAVPALLRGIFDYHVQVRGFWDIAYNFLIDAYGRVWEGRAGGIDMPVVGAHAGAYNAQSTGVAMLGDFMSVTPSPAAMSALERLLAWKLSLHGLPSTGQVMAIVDPPDAYYTPFAPGAHVSLPRIAGHRDGDLTDCPGDALYAQLPAVRRRVSALAGIPARLTTTPGAVLIAAGSSVGLSGTLSLQSGVPLGGASLALQAMGPGGPPAVILATMTTAGDGSWSQSVSVQENTLLRAVHADSPASVSDWARVSVAPVLTLSAQAGSPLILSGTVAPSTEHVMLELYRGASPSGKPIRKKRVLAATGSFRGQVVAPGPGEYVAVARTVAGPKNVAGASPPVAVTVA